MALSPLISGGSSENTKILSGKPLCTDLLSSIEPSSMEEKMRFAVLLCVDDSEYVKETYGGYFGVFLDLLAEEGELWDLYRVADGDFPTNRRLSLCDGFVVTDSCNDAHSDDDDLAFDGSVEGA